MSMIYFIAAIPLIVLWPIHWQMARSIREANECRRAAEKNAAAQLAIFTAAERK